MKKIVSAPDSFKESLTAARAAESIERGFARVFPRARYECVPIADGGEGTVDVEVKLPDGSQITQEGVEANRRLVLEEP
jgi:glycerate kinase